ncbi:hypothetical protein DF185_07885 [Marinifilum breve]|uniref:Uncharacterized protein n=1 Tax=Marinifilum breve TaxID=2184082 RepID=A0A2V3ZXI2_9BACT|nr:hypothetical protein [Marinifilum breve]PXY01395.1 hypothetical protein DF185_07885 [Marinifilum breve]
MANNNEFTISTKLTADAKDFKNGLKEGKKEIKIYEDSLGRLKSTQSKLISEFYKTKQGTTEYKTLANQISTVNSRIKEMTNDFRNGMNEADDSVQLVEGSMKALEYRQKQLLEEFENTGKGTEEYKRLARELASVNGQIRDMELDFEGLDAEQKASELKSVTGGISDMTVGIGTLGAAFAGTNLEEFIKTAETLEKVSVGVAGGIEMWQSNKKLLNTITGQATAITETSTTAIEASSVATETNTTATEANTSAKVLNKAAILGVVAVGAALAYGMYKLYQNYQKNNKAANEYTKALKEQKKSTLEEIAELKLLLGLYQSTTIPDKKTEVAKKVAELAGEEYKQNQNTLELIEKQIKAIEKKAKYQAATSALSKVYEDNSEGIGKKKEHIEYLQNKLAAEKKAKPEFFNTQTGKNYEKLYYTEPIQKLSDELSDLVTEQDYQVKQVLKVYGIDSGTDVSAKNGGSGSGSSAKSLREELAQSIGYINYRQGLGKNHISGNGLNDLDANILRKEAYQEFFNNASKAINDGNLDKNQETDMKSFLDDLKQNLISNNNEFKEGNIKATFSVIENKAKSIEFKPIDLNNKVKLKGDLLSVIRGKGNDYGSYSQSDEGQLYNTMFNNVGTFNNKRVSNYIESLNKRQAKILKEYNDTLKGLSGKDKEEFINNQQPFYYKQLNGLEQQKKYTQNYQRDINAYMDSEDFKFDTANNIGNLTSNIQNLNSVLADSSASFYDVASVASGAFSNSLLTVRDSLVDMGKMSDDTANLVGDIAGWGGIISSGLGLFGSLFGGKKEDKEKTDYKPTVVDTAYYFNRSGAMTSSKGGNGNGEIKFKVEGRDLAAVLKKNDLLKMI